MYHNSYSFSAIKLYTQCPYRYFLLKIKKIKEVAGPPCFFGMAIHHLFSDALTKDFEKKEAIKLWRRYFEKELDEVIVYKDLDFWMKKGYPTIYSFYKNIERLKIKKIICSEGIFLDDEYSKLKSGKYNQLYSEYRGFKFSFKPDLVYIDVKNKMNLLDYKTGKLKREDCYQLELYCKLLKIDISRLVLYQTLKGFSSFVPGYFEEEMNEYIFKAIDGIMKKKYNKNVSNFCKRYCYFKKIGECNGTD